ncbi:MAG: hypothetical protein QOD88_453 [Mycobacterium sp.]|jgi:preprotein translocase subunit SecF|nr:hypothetical protein [Mycobacterium sp.]
MGRRDRGDEAPHHQLVPAGVHRRLTRLLVVLHDLRVVLLGLLLVLSSLLLSFLVLFFGLLLGIVMSRIVAAPPS